MQNTTSSVPDASSLDMQARRGIAAGIGCYAFWGLCPLYWKLFGSTSSFEIIAHRVIWCWVLVVALCLIAKTSFIPLIKDSRARHHLIPAAFLITLNWGIYIYAVMIGHVVDTALGYYINPLVSILFGILFFRECLTPLQVAAVCLCAGGIAFFLIDYGQLPWIALALAFTFGLYGAIKKRGCYAAVPALAAETTYALPFALCIVVFLPFVAGHAAFLGDTQSIDGWMLTLLLVGAGPVTGIPLVLFAKAANSIPLSMLGFIQYLSPTIALLLGVFAFGEAFTFAHAVCFGCIWCGLILVSIDSVRRARKNATALS